MNHARFAFLLGLCLAGQSLAGPLGFGSGIGSAMEYGPYTGGHRYSYNTAYSYGLSFNAADSWRRDPLAYPGGIYPYRPYGRPILYRTYPLNPANPQISVPGEDGLPVLAPAVVGAPACAVATVPVLMPVPVAGAAATPAVVKIIAPEGAIVFVEKEAITGGSFQTPPLPPGKMQIYSVRARWKEAGRDVEQFRVVGVRGGETAKLTFTASTP